jgi:GTP-binding protein Era
MSFASGFIAIIGPPNVGKSTLLNQILQSKVAIVSPRPQTTRKRILGIYHGEGFQMVFVDTPGIHKTRTPLHKSMVESAHAALYEVDIILLMVEMGREHAPEIPPIISGLKMLKKPRVLAINKIDKGPKALILPIIKDFGRMDVFDEIIPISALKGEGIDVLFGVLKRWLRPGPQFFPDTMKTDQTESFLASEIIRESIYKHLRQELPYSTAVTVDDLQETPERNLLSISGNIHVETSSQKKILIGQRGGMIKAIGRDARFELEKLFGTRVYLDLTVRVYRNWSKDTRALKRLGY